MTEAFARILHRKHYASAVPIGEGGQAVVFRTTNPQGFPVAVKAYKAPVPSRETLTRAHERELEIARKLSNRSVYAIKLMNWFIEDGYFFTECELADKTIRDLLDERGGCSRELCHRLLKNVAECLDEFHNDETPLYHGDIKPENLFICGGRDFVKVGDFGAARIVSTASTVHTRTRTYSELYSLPEHWGVPTKERDQFAFAIVYAEIRLGRHPFSEPGTKSPYDERTGARIAENLRAGRYDLNGLEPDEQSAVRAIFSKTYPTGILCEWLHQLHRGQAAVTPLDVPRALLTTTQARTRSRLGETDRADLENVVLAIAAAQKSAGHDSAPYWALAAEAYLLKADILEQRSANGSVDPADLAAAYEAALEASEHAIRLDPDNGELYARRASATLGTAFRGRHIATLADPASERFLLASNRAWQREHGELKSAGEAAIRAALQDLERAISRVPTPATYARRAQLLMCCADPDRGRAVEDVNRALGMASDPLVRTSLYVQLAWTVGGFTHEKSRSPHSSPERAMGALGLAQDELDALAAAGPISHEDRKRYEKLVKIVQRKRWIYAVRLAFGKWGPEPPPGMFERAADYGNLNGADQPLAFTFGVLRVALTVATPHEEPDDERRAWMQGTRNRLKAAGLPLQSDEPR